MADHHCNEQSTRYEAILDEHARAGDGLAGALAATSRLVRREFPQSDAESRAVRDVVCGMLGPALTAFGLWVLRRTADLGLRRLYFLSRDGQLPLEVVSRLSSGTDVAPELGYLMVSRKAVVPACITAISEQQLHVAFEPAPFVSVRSCLDRIGLMPEQLPDALTRVGFGPADWGHNLDSAARQQLWTAMLESADIGEHILASARQRRELLIAYLRQEGLLSGDRCGLVDLGWYANMQRALARLYGDLCESADPGAPVPVAPFGLYFGLRRGEDESVPHLDAEGFFVDEQRQTGMINDLLPQLAAIIEPMCTAMHGMVAGYRREGQRIEPVLSDEETTYVSWTFDLLRQTVYHFSEAFAREWGGTDLAGDAGEAIQDVLLAFWGQPSATEAEAWGCLPLGDRLGQLDVTSRFGRPFGWHDVAEAFRTGVIPVPRASIWFEGSFRQTSALMRLVLKAARKVGAWRADRTDCTAARSGT